MQANVVLLILDGWGIASNPLVSAIDQAQTPFIDSLYKKYPHAQLKTSGMDVGLPDGQMGNSEVGHMNLGAGRVVYQNLARINKEIADNTLKDNQVIKNMFQKAKAENKKLHFFGLVSDGGVHSHIEHLKALCSLAKEQEIKQLYIHAFTDGRDTDPKGGLAYIEELEAHLQKSTGTIASVVGRYYSMDRDKRWERVKKAYDALVHGTGEHFASAKEAIEAAYEKGTTDEFILPSIMVDSQNQPIAKIEEGDIVFSFNFRTDRCREISQVLTQADMHEFNMHALNLHYVTMTNYDANFKNVEVVFEEDNLKNTLGEVLQSYQKKQIRIAETEKYPHVTFFFSGGREKEFEGESRILCPSPKVATYDLQPEMSAMEIAQNIVPELDKQEVNFVCLNFANADMVGHTGVFEAAVKACETVDKATEIVVNACLKNHYKVIILADHGNSDCMINEDGSPNTAHTTNPVPIILVGAENNKVKNGKLGDIAPTILKLMGIPCPKEMSGDCLVYEA